MPKQREKRTIKSRACVPLRNENQAPKGGSADEKKKDRKIRENIPLSDLHRSFIQGVCPTDLRLDTSTKGLKPVHTNPESVLGETYFIYIKDEYINIIYNFCNKCFSLKRKGLYKT